MVPKSLRLKLQADDVAATQGSTSADGTGASLAAPASFLVELDKHYEGVRFLKLCSIKL